MTLRPQQGRIACNHGFSNYYA